jgi:hypothetical protein
MPMRNHQQSDRMTYQILEPAYGIHLLGLDRGKPRESLPALLPWNDCLDVVDDQESARNNNESASRLGTIGREWTEEAHLIRRYKN